MTKKEMKERIKLLEFHARAVGEHLSLNVPNVSYPEHHITPIPLSDRIEGTIPKLNVTWPRPQSEWDTLIAERDKLAAELESLRARPIVDNTEKAFSTDSELAQGRAALNEPTAVEQTFPSLTRKATH